MGRIVEGPDRTQSALFPERPDDWIQEDSTVRVIDVFVEALDLRKLGFDRADPAAPGWPGYSPATLLNIFVNGYLNRVQSSRRLETEAQRNVELIWLAGPLASDFKTIADFRRDNGEAILECERAGGVAAGVPKPMTSNNLAEGLFDSLDGAESLPDTDAVTGANRDELAGPGLQPETGDQDPRHRIADGSDESAGRVPYSQHLNALPHRGRR